MPLLRAESGEKEAQVGLEATKDGCASIAKAVVLSRAPDEALVVDVAGGLNSCDVVKQADGVLVKTASRVGNHREEGDVKTLVWRRVLSVLLVSAELEVRHRPIAAVTWRPTIVPTILGVRVHTCDVNDELLTTTQASKVTLVGEPEVEIALLKLGRFREANCYR